MRRGKPSDYREERIHKVTKRGGKKETEPLDTHVRILINLEGGERAWEKGKGLL